MDYQPLNFARKYQAFSEHWSPRVIAELNSGLPDGSVMTHQFKLAKISGEFVWHRHENTDEVFIVLKGEMLIEFRDGEVRLAAGEMYVVPRGVEHKPQAAGECQILLVEPRGVVNTGDAGGELTAAGDVWV